MKIKYVLIIIILLTLACNGYKYYLENFDEVSPKLIMLSDMAPSTKTIVVPTLEAEIEDGKNIVYCSTFQMVWTDMCKNILKGTAEITDAPEYVNDLNVQIAKNPAITDESCYYVKTGYGKDNIVKIIESEFLKKFRYPCQESSYFRKAGPRDIVAYAYLYKNLPFNNKYKKISGHTFLSGNKTFSVKAFGVPRFDKSELKLYKEQVRIVYCDSNRIPKNFIIVLNTKYLTDEVVISTLKPQSTMAKTYNNIQTYFKKDMKEKFDQDASLIVPCIDFEILQSYDKLKSKLILNKTAEGYQITTSIQGIKFKLNEKGVTLKSFSLIVASTGISKDFYVNGPFVIYMKEKQADYPYFMAYIANDELLVKSN